jgi:hypothetical protein
MRLKLGHGVAGGSSSLHGGGMVHPPDLILVRRLFTFLSPSRFMPAALRQPSVTTMALEFLRKMSQETNYCHARNKKTKYYGSCSRLPHDHFIFTLLSSQ